MTTTAAPLPQAPTEERRIAHRRQPAMGTVCRLDPPPGDKPTIGLIWNISTSGISMLLNEPREPGSTVVGQLETLGSHHTFDFSGAVIHVKQIETGDYFLGAHFTRPMTEDELKPFVI